MNRSVRSVQLPPLLGAKLSLPGHVGSDDHYRGQTSDSMFCRTPSAKGNAPDELQTYGSSSLAPSASSSIAPATKSESEKFEKGVRKLFTHNIGTSNRHKTAKVSGKLTTSRSMAHIAHLCAYSRQAPRLEALQRGGMRSIWVPVCHTRSVYREGKLAQYVGFAQHPSRYCRILTTGVCCINCLINRLRLCMLRSTRYYLI